MKNKPWDSHRYLQKEYVDNERSTSSIAKEHGTYPITIRRALIKYGFEVRNKSVAQKNNIKKNGAPMQGKVRTVRERERISKGLQRFWDGLDDAQEQEVRNRLSENARENWKNTSKAEKNARIKKMHSGSRKKMRAGSKNENLVADILADIGYKIIQRSKDYAPRRQFEIDIALPEDRYAIEWDGVTHFDPVYGEEHLAKVQRKDKYKDELLISNGWTVIRYRDTSTTSSLAFCRRAVDKILDTIQNGERGVVHILEAK